MHDLSTRVRAVTTHEFLSSVRKAATHCGVSKSSVATWLKQADQKPRKPRVHKFPEASRIVSDIVCNDPRLTIDQITRRVMDRTGNVVSRSTVHRILHRLGFSNKVTSQCWKQQETDTQHPFFTHNPYNNVDLISIDESGFCTSDRPPRGWSQIGTRVHRGKPPRRKRLSALTAIDRHGIVATTLVYGGVKGQTFAEFLSKLPDGSNILLDNCSIHKSPEAKKVMASKLIVPIYTPPYSPWFNPIENAFGQAKSHFRKARLLGGDLEQDVCDSFSRVRSFREMFRSAEDKWHVVRDGHRP